MINAMRKFGGPNTPRDIRQLRASVAENLRMFGTPVLVKHKLTDQDRKAGTATESPNRSSTFKQTRMRDPISHGTGFVSLELSDDEWMAPDASEIRKQTTSPGTGWVPAPKYRGYGPSYLIYIIEPDRSLDFFRLSETGALFKVQDATAVAPWYPEINDNDLLINVVLSRSGTILETQERYEAKMTSPVSMRGRDRRGKREYTENFGNISVVGQNFDMTLAPDNHELYEVETDR